MDENESQGDWTSTAQTSEQELDVKNSSSLAPNSLHEVTEMPTSVSQVSDNDNRTESTSSSGSSVEDSRKLKRTVVINGDTPVRADLQAQDSVFSRSDSRDFRFKVWRCSVALIVLLVIAVVWGLCAIPIVFFHLPVVSCYKTVFLCESDE